VTLSPPFSLFIWVALVRGRLAVRQCDFFFFFTKPISRVFEFSGSIHCIPRLSMDVAYAMSPKRQLVQPLGLRLLPLFYTDYIE
jgi:hypothetical protein